MKNSEVSKVSTYVLQTNFLSMQKVKRIHRNTCPASNVKGCAEAPTSNPGSLSPGMGTVGSRLNQHVTYPDGLQGSRLHPGPDLVPAAIWEVNQEKESQIIDKFTQRSGDHHKLYINEQR